MLTYVSSQSNSDLLILTINSICRRFITASFPWAFNIVFTYERTLSTCKYPLRWSEDWGKVPSDKHKWKLDLNKKTMEKICVRSNFKQFASQLKFSNRLWCGTRFFFLISYPLWTDIFVKYYKNDLLEKWNKKLYII